MSTASRKVFDADLERFNRALLAGGWVETGVDADGTRYACVSPDAPESLLRPYRALVQYGYANGLL